MQPQHHVSKTVCYSIAVILMTSLVHGTMGCFPVDDVFKTSCLWTRPLDIDARYEIDVCRHNSNAEEGHRMTFTRKGKDSVDKTEWHWDCLKAISHKTHKNITYLVKKSNWQRTLGYQCVKFSPLTQNVIKQEVTPLEDDKDKVNCNDKVKSSMLVASENLDPVTCPLAGGYQILMHLPDNISKDPKCSKKVATYKPHLQFGCDKAGSSHVLADLGPDCVPDALQKSETMRGRHQAYLECVASWQETSGSNVLLRMQGSNSTFWCLNVRQVHNPSDTALSSPEETLHESILMFDGRCAPYGVDSVPNHSTMFGHIAAFRPGKATKCQEPSYLTACESENQNRCHKSTECPKTCGRCLEEVPPASCSFPATLQGAWESFSSERDNTIKVSGSSLQAAKHGDFTCQSDEWEENQNKGLFSLVQKGQHSTCMPYHSCARLTVFAPGLLSYQMFPANRNGDTGKVTSCRQAFIMRNSLRYKAEVITLLEPEKLRETSCNIMTNMTLGTSVMGPGCLVTLHECSGSCQTFTMSLHAETCGNQTAEDLGLLTQHTCMAIIPDRELFIMLTRSPDTKQYLCWIRLTNSVFLMSPEKCNPEQIYAAMRDEENIPKPLEMLKAIWPPRPPMDPHDRDGAVATTASATALVLAVLSVAMLKL